MKSSITGHAHVNIQKPAADVWAALTEPDLIRQYFFGTNTSTTWKVGSPIRFTGEWQGKTYEDKGTVLKFEENRELSYSYWSSMSGIEDKPENYVIVTFQLQEVSAQETRLSVTQENIPSEEMKTHSEENWNKVLRQLKSMLENNSFTRA